MSFAHRPVLVEAVLAGLAVRPDGIYLDGTVGEGGHAEAVARRLGSGGRLIGIDRDDEALAVARERLKPYGERVTLVHGGYEDAGEILDSLGIGQVDGLLLDLGFSSFQLADAERGLGFSEEGPLDMRMDRSEPPAGPVTAAQLIQRAPERELARIFFEWGEERFARRIARAIVETRRRQPGSGRQPIRTTTELAALVARVVPHRPGPQRIHPATRVFQALRIAVNREMERLDQFLSRPTERIAAGGRIAILAYHSLEDRRVKETFRREAAAGRLKILTRRPIRPDEEEVRSNPRSRSARLRLAEI